MRLSQMFRGWCSCCNVLVWKPSAVFHPRSWKVFKQPALSSGKKEMEHFPHLFLWNSYNPKPLITFYLFYFSGPPTSASYGQYKYCMYLPCKHTDHVLIKAEYPKLESEVYSTLHWYAGLWWKHNLAHSFFEFLKKWNVYYFYLCNTSNITDKYNS